MINKGYKTIGSILSCPYCYNYIYNTYFFEHSEEEEIDFTCPHCYKNFTFTWDSTLEFKGYKND